MKLDQIGEWVRSNRELLFDLIRVYLGIGLFIKGIFFLMHPEQITLPPESGFLAAITPAVPYLHIIGGLMLALGILTRLAALSQILVLFGAVLFVNSASLETIRGREAFEYSMLVLFLLVLIFIKGTGPLTVMRLRRSGAVREEYPWQKWLHAHPDVFLDLVRFYLGWGYS